MYFTNIYVDMDGVLADYNKFAQNLPKTLKFRKKVLDRLIFLNLDMMKGAQQLIAALIEYQYEWPQCRLEILSSGGSYHMDIFNESVRQKDLWLNEKSIGWPRNFTHCGESKAYFAHSKALLIDDTLTNCINFEWNEGKSVVWDGDNHNESLERLKGVLRKGPA